MHVRRVNYPHSFDAVRLESGGFDCDVLCGEESEKSSNRFFLRSHTESPIPDSLSHRRDDKFVEKFIVAINILMLLFINLSRSYCVYAQFIRLSFE